MDQEATQFSIADKLFPAGKPLGSHKEAENQFGSLIFAPKPNCSITLLQSTEIAPRLPTPYPRLPLSRFLEKNDCLTSTAASISSYLDHQIPDYTYYRGFNSLELFQIPDKNLVIAIFPTGENSDRVGFSLLCTGDEILRVVPQRGKLFSVVKEGNVNRQRITRFLANPISNCNGDYSTVGLLMACTEYFVLWYRIRIDSPLHDQTTLSASMDYLGCADLKALKGNTVRSSRWSPHFREECLVLLDNGDLLTFSIDISSTKKRFVKKKMHLSLTEKLKLDKDEKNRRWIGCEYSWHPRLFVLCNDLEVFFVDCMSECGFEVFSMQKLESLSIAKNDEFLAMAMASSDGYSYAVTTRKFLLLLHVEKPGKPVIQWDHKLENPQYITVFRISDLKPDSQETGHGIILGSFWDNSFSLFCYGQEQHENGTLLADLTSFYNSYNAWGIPSDLPISEFDCECGSCIAKRDFSKESDLLWIDFRQRKNLVLGFGVLDLLSSRDGFILIRLNSSGILDAQPYHAVSESTKLSEVKHKRKTISFDKNHLYDIKPSDYDGSKRFKHLIFEYLVAYIKGNLPEFIDEKRPPLMERSRFGNRRKSHKIEALGISQERQSTSVSDVLKDISLPVSINEIALKSLYADLPTNLIQAAFSTYSELKNHQDDLYEQPLEFMYIPKQPQSLPFTFRNPSSRSNKWSSKVKPNDALVGPILPPQFLFTANELCKEESKLEINLKIDDSDSLFKNLCDKVTKVVNEHILSIPIVSLAEDDTNDTKAKLCYHKPSAFVEYPSNKGWYGYETHSTFIFKRRVEFVCDISLDMAVNEVVDIGCPIEMNFGNRIVDLGTKEMEMLRDLKRVDLDFQASFKPYQDYLISCMELK